MQAVRLHATPPFPIRSLGRTDRAKPLSSVRRLPARASETNLIFKRLGMALLLHIARCCHLRVRRVIDCAADQTHKLFKLTTGR
jgi:hypothetical protein